jgi:hypothetical protein
MPIQEAREFARGFCFTGSIDGHRLGWSKARVVFRYRHGVERIFFEFECGLVVDEINDGARELRRIVPRLEQFAKPGVKHHVEITQFDKNNTVVGQWVSTKARLVEYSLAWDNAVDAVTPERIVFEAARGSVVYG